MGADDDTDCSGHDWQPTEVALGGGAHLTYRCTRCDAVLLRAPGQPFPD